MTNRAWGFWTENKLEILGDYLNAFNTACSLKAPKTVYLDLFAGTPDNQSRRSGELILGSARLALEADPPFEKLVFFDLPETAAQLEAKLRELYPNRNFDVIAGDSNKTIGGVLNELRKEGLQGAPIFAFLDPFNLGIQWETLIQLAEFKRNRKNKIELWILMFSSNLPRVLSSREEANPTGAQLADAFFGTHQWSSIRDARSIDEITHAEALDEYVNLLRWRLEKSLEYRYTLAFELKNTRNTLYHLIFATDNDAGFNIMTHLYTRAASTHEAMRKEHWERDRKRREEERGVMSLFSLEELPPGDDVEVVYRHEPPVPPRGTD